MATDNLNLTPDPAENEKEQLKDFPIDMPDGMTVGYLIKQAKAYEASWTTFFKPQEERIKRFDRIARTKSVYNASKNIVKIPIGENISETIIARMQGMTYASPKLVDAFLEDIITPEELETERDDEGGAIGPLGVLDEINLVEGFVNEKMFETSDLIRESEDLFTWAVNGGYGIAWPSWDFRESVRIIRDPKSKTGKRKQTRKVGFCKWESIAPLDFAWDPTLKNKPLSKSGWARRRHTKTLNELKEMEQDGFFENIDKMVQDIPPEGEATEQEEERRKIALGDPVLHNERVWRLNEYWGDIPYKDPQGKIQIWKARFFIVEGRTVLRAGNNPLQPQRIPGIMLRYKIRANQAAGSSVFEAIETMLRQIDINKGKEGDLIQRTANTPLLVDARSGINSTNLYMAPNGIMAVNDVNATKSLPIPSGALAEVRVSLQADISLVRESTPANEQAQGIATAGETATAERIRQLSGGVKFGHLSKRISSEFISPLAQEFFWYYRQFGEDGDMFSRKDNRDGLPVPILRENLERDYRWQAITIETETDKQVRLKQLKETAADLAQIAAPGAVLKLYRDHILPNLGISDADDVLPEGSELQDETVQPDPSGGTVSQPALPNEAPLPTAGVAS